MESMENFERQRKIRELQALEAEEQALAEEVQEAKRILGEEETTHLQIYPDRKRGLGKVGTAIVAAGLGVGAGYLADKFDLFEKLGKEKTKVEEVKGATDSKKSEVEKIPDTTEEESDPKPSPLGEPGNTPIQKQTKLEKPTLTTTPAPTETQAVTPQQTKVDLPPQQETVPPQPIPERSKAFSDALREKERSDEAEIEKETKGPQLRRVTPNRERKIQ